MYTIYRLSIDTKNMKYDYKFPECMSDIIILIDTNGRDNESQTTVYYFLKSDNFYKIVDIKNIDFTAEIVNEKRVILQQDISVSHLIGKSKLVELYKCNTRNELEQYALENKIILFEPYTCANMQFEIENKSNLSNSNILDLIDGMNLKRVKSVAVNTAIRARTKFIINDDENFDNFSFRKDGKAIYATSDYSSWLDKHFATELMYLFDGHYSMLKAKFDIMNTIFFVDATDMSISFHKLNVFMEFGKTNYKIIFSPLFHGTYKLGEPVSCIKYLKKNNKPVSPFEMFNINTKNISRPNDTYVFNNAKNIYDFFVKNSVFFERSGLKRLIQEMKSSMDITAILLLYISLIYEYPVIELLVKMGHCSLIEDIFRKLKTSGRKEMIIENVENLQQLINNDTTKGTLALRFPSFIGDYLKGKKANLREYLFWRDINEIKPLSKEQFDEFNDSIEKIMISASLSEQTSEWGYSTDWYSMDIQEIIKYPEYTLNKTIKYIFNQYINNDQTIGYRFGFKEFFNLLKDTLLIAEELDFVLEPYPENLEQIHNQIAEIRAKKKEAIEESVVQGISDDCEKYMETVFNSGAVDLPTKAMEKLTYIFPKTQQEFTQEGQNQHNCVAGYFSRVSSGDCIIFFVRKTDSPNESYITAEINKNVVGQVMFSNNRPVPHASEEYKYCRFIANKIYSAIERNEILALKKVFKRKKETV